MNKWKCRYKGSSLEQDLTSTEVEIGRFKLTIHRHMNYPETTWLASCWHFFSAYELTSQDVEEAKKQAIDRLKLILQSTLDDID